MVSKAVAESMVISLKLLHCTILMERMESAVVTLVMICCAASSQLKHNKTAIKKLLMVNFNRNVSVFVRSVNWDFYFITEW